MQCTRQAVPYAIIFYLHLSNQRFYVQTASETRLYTELYWTLEHQILNLDLAYPECSTCSGITMLSRLEAEAKLNCMQSIVGAHPRKKEYRQIVA